MNNYIIKRRNQIYNTKKNGFNLGSYNTSKIINENTIFYNLVHILCFIYF